MEKNQDNRVTKNQGTTWQCTWTMLHPLLQWKKYTEPSLYVKLNHSLIDVVPIVQNILPLTINKRCAMIIFPPSPSCEDCKFSKRKNDLSTSSENCLAKVTAEVDFLRTLPEDDKQRKESIQSRRRKK